MNVSDIMTEKPVTIQPDRSLAEAMSLMQQVGCRHLPVISVQGHLIGILSDRDCRTALNSPHVLREKWQDEELLNHLPVRAAMTPAPIITEPGESAREAARLILEHHISCLPVMRGETLVGIVTTSDILMAFVNSNKRVGVGTA
jgi:acetoin utilization protein AcuB